MLPTGASSPPGATPPARPPSRGSRPKASWTPPGRAISRRRAARRRRAGGWHPRALGRARRRQGAARRDHAGGRLHAVAARRPADRRRASRRRLCGRRQAGDDAPARNGAGQPCRRRRRAHLRRRHRLRQRDRSGRAAWPDRRRCPRREVRHQRRGPLPARRRGHDACRSRLRLRRARLVAGSRATTPRHQFVVARSTAAGALDASYGTSGYRAADLNGATASVYEVAVRRLRVDASGTALVVATVKSATGPASHLLGLARLTPAGALDAPFGTAGTRTQDISPSHVFDAEAPAHCPGGFVVGGGMGVGSTTQFGARRLPRGRQPGHHAQPRQRHRRTTRPTCRSAPAAPTASRRSPSRRRVA